MWLEKIEKLLQNKKVGVFQEMKNDYQRDPFRYWVVLLMVMLGIMLKTTWLDGQLNGLFFFILNVIVISGLRLNIVWVIMAGLGLTMISIAVALWAPYSSLVITASDYILIFLADCVLLMIISIRQHKNQSS